MSEDFELGLAFEVTGAQEIANMERALVGLGQGQVKVERFQKEINGEMQDFAKILVNNLNPAMKWHIDRILEIQKTWGSTAKLAKSIRKYKDETKDAAKALEKLRKEKEDFDKSVNKGRQDDLVQAMLNRAKSEKAKLDKLYADHDAGQSGVNQKTRADNLTQAMLAELKRKQQAMKQYYADHDAAEKRAIQQERERIQLGKTLEHVEKAKRDDIFRELEEQIKLTKEVAQVLPLYQKELNLLHKIDAAITKGVAGTKKHVQSLHGMLMELQRIRHSMHLAFAFTGVSMIAHGFEGALHHLYEMTKEAMEFNDEMQKSRTLLTSIGIAHTGKSQSEIDDHGSNSERGILSKSRLNSQALSTMLMSESIKLGQKAGAVFGVAQTAALEFQSSAKQRGINAMADQPDKMFRALKQSVEIAALLRSVAPPRGTKGGVGTLGQFERAEFAALRGSINNKKSASANFKPLLTLAGIHLPVKDQQEITQAANTDRFKAMDLFAKALEKLGYSTKKMDDVFENTLKPNIDAVTAQLKLLGGALTFPLYSGVLTFFQVLRKELQLLSENPEIIAVLQRVGAKLRSVFDEVAVSFFTFFDKLKNPAYLEGKLNTFVDTLRNVKNVAEATLKVVASFLAGLIGFDDTKAVSMKSMVQSLNDSIGPAGELGSALREIISDLLPLIQVLDVFANCLNILFGWVKQIGEFLGGNQAMNDMADNQNETWKNINNNEKTEKAGKALMDFHNVIRFARNQYGPYLPGAGPVSGAQAVPTIGGGAIPLNRNITNNNLVQPNIINKVTPNFVMPAQKPGQIISVGTVVQALNVTTTANSVPGIVKDAGINPFKNGMELLNEALRGH